MDDTITVPGVPVPLPVSPGLNVTTKTDLDGLAWMVPGGYTLEDTATSTMALFVGLRYFGVDASSRWNLTSDTTPPGSGVV